MGDSQDIPWRDSKEGCLLSIRLQPRASVSQILGIEAGRLKIKVTAPPVEGAANEGLQKFLAKCLQIAPSRLRLVRGEGAREKTLEVIGMNAETVKEKLLPHLQG